MNYLDVVIAIELTLLPAVALWWKEQVEAAKSSNRYEVILAKAKAHYR